jgi:hypothetical protein
MIDSALSFLVNNWLVIAVAYGIVKEEPKPSGRSVV